MKRVHASSVLNWFLKFGFKFFFAFQLTTGVLTAQTMLLDPYGDGGFENGATFDDNSWRVTDNSTTTLNQWVCSSGATPGFSGQNCAYITNNAGYSIPPHKYSPEPSSVSHIFRDITVPMGEMDIQLNFDWISQGDNALDHMRIWVVPILFQPIFGNEITPAIDRIQLGANYSGYSTWSTSPTLIIPPNFEGTTFRLVIEWANDASLEFDPPAGIDNISIISQTPPPPSNDDPCNAISVPYNTSCSYTTYTNFGATNTTTVPAPNCANYAGSDVWFTTTVPLGGGLIIDTQSDGIIDAGMAIYTGSCNALTLLECDDNSSSNGLMPAILRTNLTPGQTIFIRIWENGNDNHGTFGICVTPLPPPPPNDDCINAFNLTVNPSLICNSVTAGSTAFATQSSQPDNVVGTPNNDVWFSFVATNTNHRISLLDIYPVIGTSVELGLGLYNSPSGSCSTLSIVTSSNLETLNVNGLTIGNTYYVRVYGLLPGANSAQVNFNICVSTPPSPPINNFCVDAIELPVLPICSYQTFTNAGAWASTNVPDPSCGNYSGGDVWFYVFVDETGEITIDTEDLDMTDAAMAIYTGNNCNNLTLLECDDNSSANGAMPSITRSGLTPGEIVYIRVWENGNDDNGTFNICVTTPTPEGIVDVHISCPGEPSEALYATLTCSGSTSLGNTLNGFLQASNPIALQPEIFISSSDPCAFNDTFTSNYSSINFTVNTSGTYIFNLATPIPYFDAMGYIVVNDGNFVPGSCNTGTYIAGDDDDGASLNPQITANLIAGVPYTLITTKFAFNNTIHIGQYQWNVVAPPSEVEWYTSETGGTPIGTGYAFNPVGVPGSNLPDTNTLGVYTFWANCTGSSEPRIRAEFTIGKTWKGTIDSDWNNINNWKPVGKPTVNECVFIESSSNQPILDYGGPPLPLNPGYAKNLTIDNNAALELASGTSLTITDWIDVRNSGILLVRNNANLIQITDVANNENIGLINMQRTISGPFSNQHYIYWSSPVEDFNVANVSPGSNANLIFKWIPTISGNGVGNYGEWQQTNENMETGKGYIIRGLSGTSPTPPASISTAEFIGVPNNGIITVPVQRGSYNGGAYPGAGSSTATALDDNWNLIGNPYPSSVSASQFILENASQLSDDLNPSISGTVYLWRHLSLPSDTVGDPFYGDFGYNYNPNDYLKYNLTGSSPAGFSGYIAAGQAFFVLMHHNTPSASSSVVFKNNMRNETYRNDQFYRSNAEPERHRIWLDLISSDNYAMPLLVGYIEGATNGYDDLYDGHDLNSTNFQFYSLLGDTKLAIQGRSTPFDNNDMVNLGVQIAQSGSYEIAINTLDGLFESSTQDIFLEDTYTSTVHDLRNSPYQFTSQSGTFDDRFILRYNNTLLSIDQNILGEGISIISPNGNSIQVKAESSPIKTILVYDMLGRILIEKTNVHTFQHTMDTAGFSSGTYIVKVLLTNNKQKQQKLILKQ